MPSAILRASVTLALAALLGAAPVRADTLSVDGETVTILRDTYGVPHVFARSLRGLFYGNGYAVAQDRLGQMEFYRRSARGEMAEVVGPSAVGADRESRIDGYTEDERMAMVRRLPPAGQAVMQAYADGVNGWREKAIAGGKLLARLTAAGIVPAPWRVTDSVAIGVDMARRFGGDRGGELRNLLLLRYLQFRDPQHAWALFDDLTWKNDPAAPTTLPDADSGRRFHGSTSFPDNAVNDRLFGGEGARVGLLPNAARLPGNRLDLNALRAALAQLDLSARLQLARRYGLPTTLGSYCMAVAGSKSATGHALLLGGPQMGWMTPQIAHEVHLSGAGIDAIGMGFAGIPGVLIGHNRHLAWTTTTGDADLTDVFAERLDPQNPRRYWYKGAWRDMEAHEETIRVRGADPVTLTVYRTVHGPVVQTDEAGHLAYSRMAAYRSHEMDTLAALFQFQSAGTAHEFLDAASHIRTSHNWFCATQAGDIAWWFSGRAPIRSPGVDPRLPTPGTGEYDWQGYLTPEQMPHATNPRQGFLANWNTKPVSWWNNSDTPTWGAVWHSSRIADLLRARGRLTVEDLRVTAIDIGTNDINAQQFVPLLLRAARSHSAMLDAADRPALAYLSAWDFHARDGSVAKTIFDTWFQQVREDLFLRPFGNLSDRDLFNRAMQPSFMLHALLGRHSSVPVHYDYLKGRTAGGLLLDALSHAVRTLSARRGPIMANWRYHLGLLKLDPLPGIPAYDRGTYITIAECGMPSVTGVSVLAPGQSEDPASPHFSDQRELAGWWFFKPMVMDRSALSPESDSAR